MLAFCLWRERAPIICALASEWIGWLAGICVDHTRRARIEPGGEHRLFIVGRPFQAGSIESRISQYRTFQLRSPSKIIAAQVGTSQVRADQASLLQIGTTKDRVLQIGSRKI